MVWFWVIVLVVLIGAIAVVAAGRGDTMSEVYEDRADATVPVGRPLSAEDLQTVQLNTGVRGYRMDEVDALLARLQAEMIDREREDHAVDGSPAEVPVDDAPEPTVAEDGSPDAEPEHTEGRELSDDELAEHDPYLADRESER